MNILDRLNSGQLHAQARASRSDCVDAKGNIHVSAERARFVDWLNSAKLINGDDVNQWNAKAKSEYKARYVPSH